VEETSASCAEGYRWLQGMVTGGDGKADCDRSWDVCAADFAWEDGLIMDSLDES
jgi:hypothetical protein